MCCQLCTRDICGTCAVSCVLGITVGHVHPLKPRQKTGEMDTVSCVLGISVGHVLSVVY